MEGFYGCAPSASACEYVVSGCLAGFNCRYDGQGNPCAEVVQLYNNGRAVAICPEFLSGLPVPRDPCELKNGRVFSRNGTDVTDQFELGAERALLEALASGCRKAILKSRSPSCGHGQIYDGSFSKRLCQGDGIWAKKLADAGFELFSEEELPKELLLDMGN